MPKTLNSKPSPSIRRHTVTSAQEPLHPHDTFVNRIVGRLFAINYKLIAWNFVSMSLIGLICWVVNAQGLRSQLYVLSTRLYKIPLPGFSRLGEYEGFHKLDLAHVMAVLLLGFVWYYWIVITKFLLYGHDEVVDPRLNRTMYYRFIFTLASVIIGGDTLVFYCGLADHADSLWSETSVFVPIVATILYMALLAATAVVHVHLSVRHNSR